MQAPKRRMRGTCFLRSSPLECLEADHIIKCPQGTNPAQQYIETPKGEWPLSRRETEVAGYREDLERFSLRRRAAYASPSKPGRRIRLTLKLDGVSNGISHNLTHRCANVMPITVPGGCRQPDTPSVRLRSGERHQCRAARPFRKSRKAARSLPLQRICGPHSWIHLSQREHPELRELSAPNPGDKTSSGAARKRAVPFYFLRSSRANSYKSPARAG